MRWMFVVALAGCANTNNMGGPPDFSTGKTDSSVVHDMKMAAGDDGGADGGPSCMQIAQWPGLMPQAGYDPMNVVTFAASMDQMMPPFNALTVEDYHGMGIPYPKMVTYKLGDTYAQCDVCTLMQACDMNGCTPKWFAQGGTVTVTASDQNAAMGHFAATLQNVLLVEWDFSMGGDKPVMGGSCIEVNAASFDVTWNNPPPDGGTGDGGAMADAAMASDGGAMVDATMISDGGGGGDMAIGGCHPVVNELMTTGKSATDEFVEIFNPCQGAYDLSSGKLVYRSAGNNAGGADSTLFAFPANTKIAAGGYLVYCGAAFAGPCDATFSSGGLAQAGGAVGVRNAAGTLLDSVAYQTLTAPNNFTETAPAPNPLANQSIERLPNGTDTNNNSADFKVAMTPTPKAANQ